MIFSLGLLSRGLGGASSLEVLCQPMRDGGLGLQSLVVRREALNIRHGRDFYSLLTVSGVH